MLLLISLITFGDLAFSKEKLLPNNLLKIKVIENWNPVKDFQKFKEYSKQTPMKGFLEKKRETIDFFSSFFFLGHSLFRRFFC